MAVLLCGSMAACSEDDEDGDGGGTGVENVTLTAPEYEAHAALYEMDGNGEWKTIELTASGNYIVREASYYNSSKMLKPELSKESPVGRSLSMFNNGMRSTRSSYNGIIYGTYTVNDEGVYVLEGFGTIELVGSEDNAVSLVVTPQNGEAVTLTAEKRNQAPQSAITNALCRTWKVKALRTVIKFNGNTKMDRTVDVDKIDEYVDSISNQAGQEFSKEAIFGKYIPEEIVFTKAGTYMVDYDDEKLAVSTWTWENATTGQLRYFLNYDNMYDETESGVVSISFNNNTLYIAESEVYDLETGPCEEQSIIILTEK